MLGWIAPKHHMATPRLVGMNLKTIPATTDNRKATMNRTDEEDSPMASDACNSHCITPIKFGDPNKAVVLAMLHRWAAQRSACSACNLDRLWPDRAPVKALTGNMHSGRPHCQFCNRRDCLPTMRRHGCCSHMIPHAFNAGRAARSPPTIVHGFLSETSARGRRPPASPLKLCRVGGGAAGGELVGG